MIESKYPRHYGNDYSIRVRVSQSTEFILVKDATDEETGWERIADEERSSSLYDALTEQLA